MKKLPKFVPIVVVLLILGIGGYFLLTSGIITTPQEGGGISLSLEKKSYTFDTLKAAIALGVPLKCSYKVGDMEAEGFIKGKQWRGKILSQGKVGEVIMKDNCLYSWDETKKGAKMCFDEDIWEREDTQATPDPNVEYICGPAVITDAQFIPPSDVQFYDVGDMGNFQQ